MVYYAKKGIFYPPARPRYFIIHVLLFLLTAIFLLWLTTIFGLVFIEIGLSAHIVFLILIFSLIGSHINIPLFYLRSWKPIIKPKIVRMFFWDFVIPTVDWEEEKTLIAINVGGCLIPVIVSAYLMYMLVLKNGFQIVFPIAIAIAIDSLLINSIARPVEGVGIVTPALLPPLFTVIVAELFIPFIFTMNIFAFIYIVGTLSSLIGADILNIKEIPKLGAPVASIGGAGIFDGVFLNGIFAVMFAMI